MNGKSTTHQDTASLSGLADNKPPVNVVQADIMHNPKIHDQIQVQEVEKTELSPRFFEQRPEGMNDNHDVLNVEIHDNPEHLEVGQQRERQEEKMDTLSGEFSKVERVTAVQIAAEEIGQDQEEAQKDDETDYVDEAINLLERIDDQTDGTFFEAFTEVFLRPGADEGPTIDFLKSVQTAMEIRLGQAEAGKNKPEEM